MSEQKVKKVRQKDVKIQDKMAGLLGFYSPEELKPKKEKPTESDNL